MIILCKLCLCYVLLDCEISQLDCEILHLERRTELSLYGIFLLMNFFFFFLHEFIGTNKTFCGMYDGITLLPSILKQGNSGTERLSTLALGYRASKYLSQHSLVKRHSVIRLFTIWVKFSFPVSFFFLSLKKIEVQLIYNIIF